MPGVSCRQTATSTGAFPLPYGSVGQGLFVSLGLTGVDRLELAAGLGVGPADLIRVPFHHPRGEFLELGPAVQILEQADLMPLFLVLGPGEQCLARPRRVAVSVADRGGGTLTVVARGRLGGRRRSGRLCRRRRS